jgi:glutathione peroxidase-family protein
MAFGRYGINCVSKARPLARVRVSTWLITPTPTSPYPGDVKWNFGKFLVGKDGKILKRFEPKVQPDSPEVTAAIKEALAAK